MAGLHASSGAVSGNEPVPIVDLLGTSMSALAHAIPVIASRTGREVIVIGGLAVVCRLTRPYRATGDLDTVDRRGTNETPQLQLLLASGAEASGVSGVLVPTTAGTVHVDVLEVTDADVAQLSDDPNDRLHVLSHAWAAATATPVVLRARGTPDLTVAVAGPGPLVAMKLQSIMNRGAAKEGTDLLDIIRVTLDPTAGPAALSQLASAGRQLRRDASRHATLWFNDRIKRSLDLVRAVPEGRDTQTDDIHLVGELIQSALA